MFVGWINALAVDQIDSLFSLFARFVLEVLEFGVPEDEPSLTEVLQWEVIELKLIIRFLHRGLPLEIELLAVEAIFVQSSA
eukprot:m.169362 g.169362  ORF g.169362 m.169362 type:complete len:81 (+) comp38988_c0_seq1:178-420(+)